MLILYRSSIIALHLLLVAHIAHTFVLLTANVEDVRKIARKFVSDELAEKIADFIARATETFAHQSSKASEENIKDNSQVSAENRMYNIERHGFESLNGGGEKPKRENGGKDKAKTSTEKDKHKAKDTDTTSKPKKETKGRSRYIIESEPKDKTTEKPAKANEENSDKHIKDSIKFIDDNLLSATEKSKTKKQQQKKKSKVKPYKLLSTFDSDENNDVKDETPYRQEKEKKEKHRQRAFNDEIVLIRNAASENDNYSKKAVEVSLLVTDEPELDENVNTMKNDKVAKSGSLVIENDDKEAKWWEQDLPKHNQDDVFLKKKSWF